MLSEDCFRLSVDHFKLSEDCFRLSEDRLRLSEDRLRLSEDRLRAFFCHLSTSSVLFYLIWLFLIVFGGFWEMDIFFLRGWDIFIYLRNK